MDSKPMSEETKFVYKNTSDQTQSLVGHGKVEPDKTITTTAPVHNPNFALVGGPRMTNVEKPTKQPEVGSGNIKGGK